MDSSVEGAFYGHPSEHGNVDAICLTLVKEVVPDWKNHS